MRSFDIFRHDYFYAKEMDRQQKLQNEKKINEQTLESLRNCQHIQLQV